jgi:hypothetical protein
VEHLPCALPLDFVRRAPSLNHGHEFSWWRERLLFVSWLPWLAMLDCSGLVTLLDHVRRRIGRQRWSVVSYRAGYWLLCLVAVERCKLPRRLLVALFASSLEALD